MRRWAIIGVLAVSVLLANLPGSTAQGDSYAGWAKSTCDGNRHLLASVPLDGTVAFVGIKFGIEIRGGTTAQEVVGWRWVTSAGQFGPTVYYSSPAGQTQLWWLRWNDYSGTLATQQSLKMSFTKGTIGTATFSTFQPADYGDGCYTVRNVVVTVEHYTNTGGGGGAGGGVTPTASPDPSATPGPTQPPQSPDPSASPPVGWCYIDDWESGYLGTGLWAPCETPPPSPSPSPTPTPTPEVPTCDYTKVGWTEVRWTSGPTWTVIDGPAGITVSSGNILGCDLVMPGGGSYGYPPEYEYQVTLQLIAITDGGSGSANACQARVVPVGGSGVNVIQVNWTAAGGSPCQAVGYTQASAWTQVTYSSRPTAMRLQFYVGSAGGGHSVTMRAKIDVRPYQSAFPTPTPDPSPSITPDPSSSPTTPPEWGGSPPPPLPGTGGGESGGGIDCTGADADLAICDPSVTYSFAPPSIDPDGVAQLVEEMKDRAPFGYAYQAVTALTDAAGNAAGSSAALGCLTFPTWWPGGDGSVQWCIPWDEMAATAAPLRFVFLAVLMVLWGVALIRLARRTAASSG